DFTKVRWDTVGNGLQKTNRSAIMGDSSGQISTLRGEFPQLAMDDDLLVHGPQLLSESQTSLQSLHGRGKRFLSYIEVGQEDIHIYCFDSLQLPILSDMRHHLLQFSHYLANGLAEGQAQLPRLNHCPGPEVCFFQRIRSRQQAGIAGQGVLRLSE